MISAVVPSRKPLKSSVSPIPSVSIRFETPALQRFSQRQRQFRAFKSARQAPKHKQRWLRYRASCRTRSRAAVLMRPPR